MPTKTIWICTKYRKTGCKARVTTSKNMAVISNDHNHQPNCAAEFIATLPFQTVKVFQKRDRDLVPLD
ncbi:unnamed protein product [Acanthoscelides obtectus]|uniref:FLYWCH-type domain-containing protein n=1 Tax=Acanthoscelides obtectus TaxID=200917 RepID=A0A9P0L9B5_ACAOB|nr:unnamed protein product [Acanthoscelides obtectus]CAH2014708.1 unnamed protein product [Acanthoscelides obtectus]CAK1676609.1 hypothetical protein AOBTE_LOCUS30851 [Acanthoscelides obtectus]CAK1676618.1 hypothetical protein AOBTE_LOCUS30860 [Acanthoscelides obtectus]